MPVTQMRQERFPLRAPECVAGVPGQSGTPPRVPWPKGAPEPVGCQEVQEDQEAQRSSAVQVHPEIQEPQAHQKIQEPQAHPEPQITPQMPEPQGAPHTGDSTPSTQWAQDLTVDSKQHTTPQWRERTACNHVDTRQHATTPPFAIVIRRPPPAQAVQDSSPRGSVTTCFWRSFLGKAQHCGHSGRVHAYEPQFCQSIIQ